MLDHKSVNIGSMLFPAPGGGSFEQGGKRAERAREVFEILQDRHVPITPQLAISISDFEAADVPARQIFWGRAYHLCAAEIGLAGKMGQQASWAGLFPIFLNVVIEPILRSFSDQMQGVLLTTKTAHFPIQDTAQYSRKCSELNGLVDHALRDVDELGRGFWINVGMALLSAFRKNALLRRSRTARRRVAVGNTLPDRRMPQLIFGIEPVLGQDRRWLKKMMKSAAKSKRVRVGIRPREGGVTGVLHTRRERDISDALPSAFVVPEDIRLIKLLEEGFMIPHRPPYRRPDRDLLSMTFRQPNVSFLASADLVSAAWVDATVRLQIVLAKMALSKSEIGFGHTRAMGTVGSAVSVENNMESYKNLDPATLKEALRARLISTSSLLPSLFEQSPAINDRLAEQKEQDPEMASAQVVRQVCELEAAKSAMASKTKALSAPQGRDYATTAVFEMSSVVVRGDEWTGIDWSADRRDMVQRYGLDKGDTVFCGKILCPPKITAGSVFVMCSDNTRKEDLIEVPRDEDQSVALGKTIGALSEWFITQNIMAAIYG